MCLMLLNFPNGVGGLSESQQPDPSNLTLVEFLEFLPIRVRLLT